jgi:beta-phosphoglucomutase-like phosphatase (HAD superfamily)/dTDP-glucose pyrophosphorylase
MTKIVIFDLDGVLIDSKEYHYNALNMALPSNYRISREEHVSIYDGLPTRAKLELLTRNKGLPVELYDEIWETKQYATLKIFNEKVNRDIDLIYYFDQLSRCGYKIAVASNSIRNTVKIILLRLGIMEYVDYYVSNEDVSRNKPFPEMYWKCMIALGALPEDTVILEDSHIGRQGALDSKAHLVPIENREDLKQDKIDRIKSILEDSRRQKTVAWESKNLNILIPMAGRGSRFESQGYTFPKPLIEVNGKPMIELVVKNLNIKANYIFIVQEEHYHKYNLKYLLNLIAPDCKIVCVNGITEGAACTTLLAREYIDNDNPLLTTNCDQFIEWNSNETLYSFVNDDSDASILTFNSTHPKWSYAKLRSDGYVGEVAEKRPISNNATVGMYFWKRGSDYVKYADQMIDKNVRTNGEFYICPVFNEAISDGKKVRIKEIDKMWGIGTPEDLNFFLEHYKGEI